MYKKLKSVALRDVWSNLAVLHDLLENHMLVCLCSCEIESILQVCHVIRFCLRFFLCLQIRKSIHGSVKFSNIDVYIARRT